MAVDSNAFVVGKNSTLHKMDEKNAEAALDTDKRKRGRSLPCYIGCGAWCRKYFWEGQTLANDGGQEAEEGDSDTWGRKLIDKYRRAIALIIPVCAIHFIWWSVMVHYDLLHLFNTRWQMTVTMIFGGIVAGMTSEGGGAVAFPVMTLLLGVTPGEARDYALFIQGTGMTCATFAIVFMGVQVEWYSIVFGTVGGIVGLMFGFYNVDPYIPNEWKKMAFVSIWFSFAFALFLLNRYHKRKTYKTIPQITLWKCLVLFLGGFVGGVCTSFAGGGVDICSFSILTLLFRVSEKTATPTSVVMMALVSLVGSYWRVVVEEAVSLRTYEFYAVSGQMVVVGAPTGAILGSHFHRLVLASAVYVLDTAALITAFILIPQTALLAGVSVGIIVGGFIFFYLLTVFGQKIMKGIEADRAAKISVEKGVSKASMNGVINVGYEITDEKVNSTKM